MRRRYVSPGLIALLTLFGATACSTVSFTPYQELTYPPSTEVEVLQQEPSRPYEVLGEMWVSSNDTNGILKMRQKAMEIGADAIVLLGERTTGVVAVPIGAGAVAAPVGRAYAAAIRYER